MIRIDAIKDEVSRMDLGAKLLPGEPYLLVIPDSLSNHPVVKRATDLELYTLRSAILVGEVLPALYGKLEVDFVRLNAATATAGSRRPGRTPALVLTYIPEGIQDARVTTRVDQAATVPQSVQELMQRSSQRPELARALFDKQWPVRLIAQEFGCSKTLIRRDIGRATLDHGAVERYARKIPAAPTITTVSRQGIHARDRDVEFEFRKAVDTKQLRDLKARAERYEAMRLDGRNHLHVQAFAARLWLDVQQIIEETGASVSRLAVELGYTAPGMRRAIASATRFVASHPQTQEEAHDL